MSALSTTAVAEKPLASEPAASTTAHPVYRLRPVMRQGTTSSIAEVWNRYATLDEARQAAKHMYHDDRVARAFVVIDEVPPRFVEWIER